MIGLCECVIFTGSVWLAGVMLHALSPAVPPNTSLLPQGLIFLPFPGFLIDSILWLSTPSFHIISII